MAPRKSEVAQAANSLLNFLRFAHGENRWLRNPEDLTIGRYQLPFCHILCLCCGAPGSFRVVAQYDPRDGTTLQHWEVTATHGDRELEHYLLRAIAHHAGVKVARLKCGPFRRPEYSTEPYWTQVEAWAADPEIKLDDIERVLKCVIKSPMPKG